MRSIFYLPPGAALLLVGCCLFLLECGVTGQTVGGRHIRRITTADLPSSNSTSATKIRLKKLQKRNEGNCTITDTCTTASPTSPAPAETSSKAVSSFEVEDVLQNRQFSSSSPYEENYESYFEDIVAGGEYSDGAMHAPKKKYSTKHYLQTEATNFEATLTTPRISIFDDFHARVTDGIRQNLEEMDKLRGVTPAYSSSNIEESRGDSQFPTLNPNEKANETVSLDFSSNLSVIYNNSRKPNSLKKDLIIENGTHIDFEKARTQNKIEPEYNKTIYYFPNNTSASTPLKLLKTHDDKTKLSIKEKTQSLTKYDSTNENLTTEEPAIVPKTSNIFETNDAKNLINLDAVASTNHLNKTGTPGDKYSTTSEPTRGRFYLRSRKIINNTTEVSGDNPNVTNKPVILKNVVTISSTNKSKISITKDPESNVVSPTSTVSTTTNTSRGSRMLTSKLSQNNTANDLQEPSPISSDNVHVTKKPKVRNSLYQLETNKTESNVSSENSTDKADLSKLLVSEAEENFFLLKISENSNTSTENKPSAEKIIKSAANNELQIDGSSTVRYTGTSTRSRAFPHRRPFTPSSELTPKYELESTTSGSSAVNIEGPRRRGTTTKQPSTTVLISSSNYTTESNTILRGWPSVARPSVDIKSSNRTQLSKTTENNEGNDIISAKNNVYKPIIRNRGNVRYGAQNSSITRNGTSSFSIPPTAAAWTLVTLKGPGNESRTVHQPGAQNSSDSPKQSRPPTGRWTPIRRRKPWNSADSETTTAPEEKAETSESTMVSKTVTEDKQVTQLLNSMKSKKTQPSSMQENRLSTIQVIAPHTDKTEDSTSQTIRRNDEEYTSQSPQTSTETESSTGGLENTTEDISYKTTEATIFSTTLDLSTETSSSYLYATLSAESLYNVTAVTTSPSEAGTYSTDSSDVTTQNFESTTETTDGNILSPASFSSLENISSTTDTPHMITSTTEDSLLQITSTEPTTTISFDGHDSVLIHAHADTNQQDENPDKNSGNNYENTNIHTEETKQVASGNVEANQQDEYVNRPANEEENRPGEIQQGTEEVEDLRNSDGNKQLDNSNFGDMVNPTAAAAEEEEAPDILGIEGAVTDHAITTSSSGLPASTSNELYTFSMTSTESSTSSSGQTTTWSSSTSAIEWEADSTTLPAVSDVTFYLVLTMKTSWSDFCKQTDQFKNSVVKLMADNERTLSTYQIVLPNLDCQKSGQTSVNLEMYLVDENNHFEPDLTSDFYHFWKKAGLQDFPIEISTVVPEGQTSDGSQEDNGGNAPMIAAITISCIGAVCLLLLAVLWVVMRKRQQRFNYGQRCTPVSLDAYSLDSVSVCGSVRRKGVIRNSKRSYGNAGFDDPGSPSHPMGYAGLANFILNRESIEEEFANIPQVTANVDELPDGADTKNRYSNVIPLPETRVQLTLKEGEPLSDYINANYVHGPKKASKYYIACQAPLTSTVTDFWRMIWEQQSKIILMLTDLVENGSEKCADYLPPSEVLDCHRLFGDFQITLKKREVKEKYIISTLQLKNLETNSWREVMHLWYVSWPTQGVPEDVSTIIAFLLEARPYIRGGPCVVHCSPGTGRTGTVITCDLCIRDFETARIVDIPRCVARLRRDRAGAVQTRDQYVFIYQVINFYGAKLTGGALDSM